MEPAPKPHFVGGTAEALAAALKRRVGEGKPISIKQLAYTLHVSEDAVGSWMNGNRNPRGDHLIKLIAFFDTAFANEILAQAGVVVAKLSDRRAAALRKVAEGMAELKAMEGAG